MLTWIFLESTTALAILLGLALFGLVVYWRNTLRPRPLLIGLVVSAVLLIVQAVVHTPREIAADVLDPVATDLAMGRTARLAAELTEDFRAGDMDRRQFLAFAERMLERVDIHVARSTSFEIVNRSSDGFDAVASYLANVTVRGAQAGYVPSRWRVRFERRAGVWRITAIEPVEIMNRPMRDWNQVERLP